ncbi:hypothetical protein GCM10007301_32630 [Azorhizobium oxalatiphilum]|uniref:DUF2325 domain-containing protein n=1 Tax=Azorhizobium oxalatiphilum TaxID=980631 RepID=A0A917C3C9_9HYPH|nr:DUF2325 domain-containing protein [Azorhizobium oxalatiphilum]GGF70334.1 hypothetical protein GCM10007301_32630 [Azorhizobium oxalatiphilum]
MNNSPVLLRHFAERAGMLPSARKGLAEDVPAPIVTGEGRREHLWELSSNLHCSIIGTCLSTADLRSHFAKLKEPKARTASDHELHSLGVMAAGRRDVPGKLLNKLLDRRHEGHIRRFAKARSVEEVRAQWRECLDKGDVPGAYWAVLTHPHTDSALVREVFGDVHMLSHLVGMSNRADIARLRELERDLGARDDKIARQEARMQEMAQERSALLREVEQLRMDLRRALEMAAAPAAAPVPERVVSLRRRLADEQARTAALAEKLAARDAALAESAARAEAQDAHVTALEQELTALESSVAGTETAPEATEALLEGRRLLYVGGRPRQIEQVRALVEGLGGALMVHDGGMEENTTLLPGLISQADVALFPVDCVSHLASTQVKRLCRDAGKPFVPLRTSGLASFAAVLPDLVAPRVAAE